MLRVHGRTPISNKGTLVKYCNIIQLILRGTAEGDKKGYNAIHKSNSRLRNTTPNNPIIKNVLHLLV